MIFICTHSFIRWILNVWFTFFSYLIHWSLLHHYIMSLLLFIWWLCLNNKWCQRILKYWIDHLVSSLWVGLHKLLDVSSWNFESPYPWTGKLSSHSMGWIFIVNGCFNLTLSKVSTFVWIDVILGLSCPHFIRE
jgi:hypothetical protein